MTSKVAFITGGTKGIGLGIAEILLKNGLLVAITGRTEDGVQECIALLNEKYKGRVMGIKADVRNMDEMSAAVHLINEKFGPIDVTIANAGIGHFAPIDELTLEHWQETIDTNLTGVFYTLKASLNNLKSSKGYFITIASLAGTNFFEQGAAYNASKFGLVGFTQAVMLDLRKFDIKCTTIMPGSVATYFNNHVPNETDGWKIQAEDLGEMVWDLLKMNPRTLPSKIEVRPSKPK